MSSNVYFCINYWENLCDTQEMLLLMRLPTSVETELTHGTPLRLSVSQVCVDFENKNSLNRSLLNPIRVIAHLMPIARTSVAGGERCEF